VSLARLRSSVQPARRARGRRRRQGEFGGAYLKWCVTYTREGLPAFKLLGEEWDLFHDGKMTMHHEVIHNTAELLKFLSQHDEQLLPAR
jgi:hypothetical protein